VLPVLRDVHIATIDTDKYFGFRNIANSTHLWPVVCNQYAINILHKNTIVYGRFSVALLHCWYEVLLDLVKILIEYLFVY